MRKDFSLLELSDILHLCNSNRWEVCWQVVRASGHLHNLGRWCCWFLTSHLLAFKIEGVHTVLCGVLHQHFLSFRWEEVSMPPLHCCQYNSPSCAGRRRRHPCLNHPSAAFQLHSFNYHSEDFAFSAERFVFKDAITETTSVLSIIKIHRRRRNERAC